MTNDIAQVASAVVTLVAPFTPYLLEAGKTAGQKWIETVAEKGGEATWNKVKTIWTQIQSRWGDDAKLKGAALMLSADPEDSSSQMTLAKVLGTRFQEDAPFVEKIMDLIGGPQAIQEILADRNSWVEQVTQEIEGTGIQRITANNASVVRNIRQTKL